MNYYIGIDIGGTKIAQALIRHDGKIFGRTKVSTPKGAPPREIYAAVLKSLEQLLKEAQLPKSKIKGIGLAVPGIVDTHKHRILAAPNIRLAGYALNQRLRRKFRVPVVMVNDVNAGLLGEAWLGAAKGLKHVAGIFPGTGVGGAAIIDGKLLLGLQGAATEFGHIIVSPAGPLCHCGNYGCLEALASRWAIERDIRQLLKSGQKSVIVQLTNGKLSTIKSRILKEALKRNDKVVKSVLTKASVILGKAAISLNHIFNPQAILFGGGLIKGCGHFMLPIVQKSLKADPFFKKFNSCRILQSKLGDDAVPLGAVRLLQARK